MSLDACLALCVNSTACLEDCLLDAGWTAPSPDLGWVLDGFLSTILVVLSAIFSGLTLGLMSLDKLGLQILQEGGDPAERRHARAIAPIREKGNLLLCTLLLGNVTVNSLLAITMARVTNGLVGFLASTALILLLGEILPQAICSRHGLAIGAHTLWVVKVFIFLFYPIAWPISKLLDKMLGREMGMVYSREEIQKLIELHVTNPEAQLESGLTKDDHRMLIGVMEYKKRRVREVMTELDNVYMLDCKRRLDFSTLFEIYKSGFTRIPVFDTTHHNVIGILYAKDLILVDPQDQVEIRTILSFHGGEVKKVNEDTTLDYVLNEFKTSNSHMLFATRLVSQAVDDAPGSPGGYWSRACTVEQLTGIITLEDVIEEIIRDEIVDETDMAVDANRPKQKDRRTSARASLQGYLNLYEHDHRLTKEQHTLSAPEVQAVTAFLHLNVDEFKLLPAETVLKGLVFRATLIERHQDKESEVPVSPESQDKHMVYRRGMPAPFFTLVIAGKLLIRAGKEGFESEMGPWTSLGEAALRKDDYVPDYSAIIAGHCRLLQIYRRDYLAAMRLAQPEMITASRQLKQAIVDMEYENESRQNSPLLVNHRRIDENEEPRTPLLMDIDSSRAEPDGLSPEMRALNRLTSLGSANWGRLEQEAQGRGVIIRFDNMRYKQETTVSIYTRDHQALLAKVTDAFTSIGLRVRSAKIYTEGDKALDVFGVVGESGEQVPEDQFDFVRQHLLSRVFETN